MLVCPKTGSDKIDSTLQICEEGKKVHSQIIEDDFFVFLKTRQGKLDGIVVTGGEPTIHCDLPEFIKKIKNMGFKVKIDTNGTNPDILSKLIKNKMIDYVAMDIKSSSKKYEEAIGARFDLRKVLKSVKIIKDSRIQHEFRTTVIPGLVEKHDIEEIGGVVEGANQWFLQSFKSDTDLLDNNFKEVIPYSTKILEEMREIGEKFVEKCSTR